MFINTGARNLLMQGERQKFLAEEWPRVHATIQRLGLKAEELLNSSSAAPPSSNRTSSNQQSSHPEEEKSKP
jgi:GntR family transcriptional regulator